MHNGRFEFMGFISTHGGYRWVKATTIRSVFIERRYDPKVLDQWKVPDQWNVIINCGGKDESYVVAVAFTKEVAQKTVFLLLRAIDISNNRTILTTPLS